MTDEAALSTSPAAALGPSALGIGGLFSTNNPLMQIFLYSVLGSLVGAAFTPAVQEITNRVWPIDPALPLSPADLAMAVVRQIKTEPDAAAEALLSGVSAARFHELYLLSGDAPAPELLAVALRRELINEATYERGVAQGRLRTEWAPLLKQMAVQQPSPIEPLEALLEGQLDAGTAKRLYLAYGGDPDSFEWRFNSRGSAPTPLELVEMARRHVIPWTGTGPNVVSYEQGFLEGPWRNKWLDPYKALSEYLIPPRSISAMYRAGALTSAEATELLAENGVPAKWIPAFLIEGTSTKTQATKDLALSTLRALYDDKLLTRAQVLSHVGDLGYSPDEAEFTVQVWDLAFEHKYLGLALSRLHTLYTSHRLDKAAAVTALAQLGMESGNVTAVMVLWDLERSVNVKLLTPAEIATAYKWLLMSADEALGKLAELGYSDADAWLYLAQHNHGKGNLPDPPSGVVLPPPIKTTP